MLLAPAAIYLLGMFAYKLKNRARMLFVVLAIFLSAAALLTHFSILFEGVLIGLGLSRIVTPTRTYLATIAFNYVGALLAIALALRPALLSSRMTVSSPSTIVSASHES